MLKRASVLLLVAIFAVSAYSQERGAPIYTDSFDTSATFAEKWVPNNKTIKSEDGKIIFPKGGTLIMRGNTPLEFYAEMDISLSPEGFEEKVKEGQAFCGFMINGLRFMILPSGNTWMIYTLSGQERSQGKQIKIDGFEQGKPVKLTLIRKIDNAIATYTYKVNGKDAGSFVADAPVALPTADGGTEPLKPLEIFSYNLKMILDNFSLCAVKRSSDDSPNVIFNSSFEYEKDSFPLYYCRSAFNFNYAKSTTIPYENFLSTWTLDTAEKHSGNKSLKMVFNESTSGQNLWAWGAGTVKDMPGVFSVWMKADKENFPVTISYGKRQEVKVGTEWKRYEIVNPKLPGAGVYSPVTISFNKVQNSLG